MEEADLEKKLTPAARDALQELVEDYRRELLFAAADSAVEATGELREIAVSDVLRAHGLVRNLPDESRRRDRVEKLLSAYVYVGMLAAMAGTSVFMFQQITATVDPARQIPFLLSISGVFLAGMAYLLLRLRQNRLLVTPRGLAMQPVSSSPGAPRPILLLWQELELALRNRVARSLGESVARQPISVLIAKLHEEHLLTEDDEKRLRQLLEARNAVVHGRRFDLSAKEVDASVAAAHEILQKLTMRTPA